MLKKLLTSKYLYHVIFWLMVVNSFLFEFFWVYNVDFGLYLLIIILKTILLGFITYTNILVLIPMFWKPKKYIAYWVFIAVLIGGMSLLINRIDYFIWDKYYSKFIDYEFKSRFYIDITTVIRYLFYSFILQVTVEYHNQEKRLKDVEIEKLKAEFNALQAQVNPHFLFNTLNNLYGLILEKSNKSAEVTLRLADLLKYMLAEGKLEKVLLSHDLENLKNYIELEQIRLSDTEGVTIDLPQNVQNQQITPLLLLPLVENAFKYGIHACRQAAFLTLRITVENDVLMMSISNSKPSFVTNSLGMGIENVQRRLALLYPDKYDLTIPQTENEFSLSLKLILT